MNIIEFFQKLFKNNKKNARIVTNGLKKVYGDKTPLEIGLFDGNEPLIGKDVKINLHGVDYTRVTDKDGIARLNINLAPEEYTPLISFSDSEYNLVTAFTTVLIQDTTRMEGTDINMIYKDGTKYQCAVYGSQGRVAGDVDITVNGVTYLRNCDETGLYKLNINLEPGTYKVTARYHGDKIHTPSEVTNKIVITPAKEKKHFGYWIFGKDMPNVNLQSLRDNGVTDILLNYYAFQAHGDSKVEAWITQANNLGIAVHIWMQCFYDGEWHNPKTTDLTGKVNEAKKYANIPGVTGVHLDYLRYPGTAYKTNGGAEAITSFVQKVRDTIGNKTLSCAVMPENNTKYYYGQDIEALGKICDVIIPMQYKGNYKAGTSWLATTTINFSSKSIIWSGLQSYKSDEDLTLLSTEELTTDVKTCLDNGAKGALLFRHGLSNAVNFKQFNGEKIATRMEGTNINMTYKDGTKYQCAVYDSAGRVSGDVDITVNGVTYRKNCDSSGLYKLSINLEPGDYTVNANYLGDDLHLPSSIQNSIHINKAPEPTPTKLYPYITTPGGGKLGQTNGYRCGPHSLMQCIYRLTGIELSESDLAGVCGTTTGGTSHSGLETGLAWFNRKYGYNLKMVWKNFSEIGFDNLQHYIDTGALLFHLLYRDTDGHYEVPQRVSGNNIIVLNSLGSYCGYPAYCGYIETRSKAAQQSYINGISQKSVCIITR